MNERDQRDREPALLAAGESVRRGAAVEGPAGDGGDDDDQGERDARRRRRQQRRAARADSAATGDGADAAEAGAEATTIEGTGDPARETRADKRARRVLRSSRDAFPEEGSGSGEGARVGGAAGAGETDGEGAGGDGAESRALTRYRDRRAVTRSDKRRDVQTTGRGSRRNNRAVAKVAETAPTTLTARQRRALALPTQALEPEGPRLFGRLLRWSFLVVVLLPVLGVAFFYAALATPQYAATSQFSVRGPSLVEDTEAPSILSGSGPPSMPEIADSLVLVDYIHSREVVDSLIENTDFLSIYSRPEIDFHYRLDPNAPIEDIVDYWRMMSDIHFDETSMIMTLTVRAFRPEEAERIAAHVIALSEDLVNELSMRARNDSVELAREEVRMAEERFREARAALAEFRDREREIDPTATATSQQEIVGALQSQLSEQQALLSSLRATMSEDAPRVLYVKNQIEALRRQIAAERENVARPEEIGGASEPMLTRRLSRFEELEAEREFAQEAYTSALAALETARMEAAKQQRYLAVFVRPAVPQEALYPEGLRWTLIVAAGLLLGWGILALVAAAFRDKMA